MVLLYLCTAEILSQNTNIGDKHNEIGDKSAINPEIGDKKQQILASRTRDYLKQLVEEGKLLAMGANKNRTYKLR